MTIVKTINISSKNHLSTLSKYLKIDNKKHTVVARESQNLINNDNWFKEFEKTRIAYGHDTPARAGAKGYIAQHVILAFNPDDKLDIEQCMNYAREYIHTRYENQEALWVCHDEFCKTDQTHRLAVHAVIGRTNLVTGKRLEEGLSKYARIERANLIRSMDEKYGLKKVLSNQRNCMLHARQPSRAEQEMLARGVIPIKEQLRKQVELNIREIARSDFKGNKVRRLAQSLDSQGIKLSVSKDKKQLQFQKDGLRINGQKLGRGYSMQGILHGLKVTQGIEESERVSLSEEEGMRM